MLKSKSPMTTLALVVGVAAACLTAVYLLYPRAIAELYGKDMPQAWAPELGDMTFSQIYQRLGAPQEDASAKDFQRWVEVHWWGRKLLMVAAADCCKPTNKPHAVVYIVLVDGWYAPAYQRTLVSHGANGEVQTPR
jgi:hypothetical protein